MIAIIDYGAGNTRSVMNALDRLNADYLLTKSPKDILAADKVIFPGVGHAAHAMNKLQELQLIEVVRQIKKPLLGICVGMQLLYGKSEEGNTTCIGVIEGTVRRFEGEDLIVPQMGWSQCEISDDHLFDNVGQGAWFYSVHSYRADVNSHSISTASYGGEYCMAVRKDNFYGVQFHPEKSAQNGQQLLKNFLVI